MKKSKPLLLIFFLCIVALSTWGFMRYCPQSEGIWDILASYSEEGPPQEFTVEKGLMANAVAKKAQEEGLVTSAESLSRWFVRLNVDRRLQPGTYLVKPGIAYSVAKQFLQKDHPRLPQICVLPGMSFTHLLEILNPYCLSSDFEAALAEKENFPSCIISLLPSKTRDRFVFIFPETYNIPQGRAFAQDLVHQAALKWVEAFCQDLQVLSMDSQAFFEKSVLASIVEKEVARRDESALVAGVFMNRLKKNMPLQSCATVIYAWQAQGVRKKALLHKDLEIRSPYNTYKNPGLPPGPICIPSQESWQGAFFPQKHDYFYFVARGDRSHIFSKTYKDHIKAKKKLQP